VAKITGQGLSAIAILVALLWGCLVGEQVIVRRANQEARQALRQVRLLRMKQQLEPASAPRFLAPRPRLG
jgi:hypothetical protein